MPKHNVFDDFQAAILIWIGFMVGGAFLGGCFVHITSYVIINTFIGVMAGHLFAFSFLGMIMVLDVLARIRDYDDATEQMRTWLEEQKKKG